MTDYNKPPFDQIPFRFTSGGYSKPDFNNVGFSFGAGSSATSSLGVAINVTQLYKETTYTYVKDCPTYVIGYGAHGIQILKGKCIYGGIRDVGINIHGNLRHSDLAVYLKVISFSSDLYAFIRATIQTYSDVTVCIRPNVSTYEDIKATIRNWAKSSIDISFTLNGYQERDLYAYLHSNQREYSDLNAALRIWVASYVDLNVIMHGYQEADIHAYLYSIPPSDLYAILNIIEVRDLFASITGEWLHGIGVPLKAYVHVNYREYVDLIFTTYSWDVVDLFKYIVGVTASDLQATITGYYTFNRDLAIYINSIPYVDLFASVHSWQLEDFGILINGVYGDNVLFGIINAVAPADITATIEGFKGIAVPRDLLVRMSSYNESDLRIDIKPITPLDLFVYINAVGTFSDLRVMISPKVIYLSKVVSVSLLEHSDLKALVNFACFGSSYSDLSCSLYCLNKIDLRGIIWGWDNNTSDMSVHINTGVLHVEDIYLPSFLAEVRKYAQLPINIDASAYYAFDTIIIGFGASTSILRAYINGIQTASDLRVTITPEHQVNYSGILPTKRPKTHLTVINLEPHEPMWKREVELKFYDSVPHYFYISGNKKIYKLDRSRTWVLRVEGYEYVEDNMIEKGKIRSQYVFDLSKYSTIDEAVRDAIDRVSMFRRSTLNVSITATGGYSDLAARIYSKRTFHWWQSMNASITACGGVLDLEAAINGVL